MKRKSGCLTLLGILLLAAGPFFLIRSCTSKYNEYSFEGSARVFRNVSTDYIVYIKDFFKVKSYSQEGGLISIGGKHLYFLETRDASTLQLIKSTPLKVSDIISPDLVGNSGKILWIFNQQLLGYDPFTHTVICDENKLGQLNPELFGNLPAESKYYKYDYQNNQLEITTKNARRYILNDSFKATLKDDYTDKEPASVTSLKAQLNMYRSRQKADKRPSSYFLWYDTIKLIDQRIDELEEEYKNQKDFREKLNEIHDGNSISIEQLITNVAVEDSIVYVFTPKEKMDTASHYIYASQNFSAEELNYLSKSRIQQANKSGGMYSSLIVEKQTFINQERPFLKGCFLLDKETLQAIELNDPESWLVISAREIGQNSPLILHRADKNGKTLWSKELPIKGFLNIFLAGNYLIILSDKNDYLHENKQSDLLLSIELKTGTFKLTDLKQRK